MEILALPTDVYLPTTQMLGAKWTFECICRENENCAMREDPLLRGVFTLKMDHRLKSDLRFIISPKVHVLSSRLAET